jgi:hypothetical protein
LFDEKLKKYEDEVANLKSKIENKKSGRPVSSSEKDKAKFGAPIGKKIS